MELPIPRYFLTENAKALKEREKLLGSILAQMEAQDDTKVSILVSCILVMTLILPYISSVARGRSYNVNRGGYSTYSGIHITRDRVSDMLHVGVCSMVDIYAGS